MMSARVLKHTHQTGRFYRCLERAFEAVIAFYGRTLQGHPATPDRDLAESPPAHLYCTTYQFIEIPKGFFPIQDTGIIQGVSRGAPGNFIPCHVRSASSAWPPSS